VRASGGRRRIKRVVLSLKLMAEGEGTNEAFLFLGRTDLRVSTLC